MLTNGLDAKVLRYLATGGGRAKDIAHWIGERDGRSVTVSLRRLRAAGLVSCAISDEKSSSTVAFWTITEAGRKAAEEG